MQERYYDILVQTTLTVYIPTALRKRERVRSKATLL